MDAPIFSAAIVQRELCVCVRVPTSASFCLHMQMFTSRDFFFFFFFVHGEARDQLGGCFSEDIYLGFETRY